MGNPRLPRLLAFAISVLILVGCAGAPKPVSHAVPARRPYWEYTYLGGWGSDQTPEADTLRQEGWVFVGYNRAYGGTMAIDEKSEVAKQMAIVQQMDNVKWPRDDLRATFKRECK